MTEVEKYTILESWPQIKEDLTKFISDPYNWLVERFDEALRDYRGETRRIGAKNIENIDKLADILKVLHSTMHSHE